LSPHAANKAVKIALGGFHPTEESTDALDAAADTTLSHDAALLNDQ
jgi:hypothetical protein